LGGAQGKAHNGRIGTVCGAFVVSLVAVLILGSMVLAQVRPSASLRPSVEPSQPVILVVDGKLVEADSLDWKRGDQVMVWLRQLENLGWGKTSAGENGAILFQGSGVTLSFVKGQGVAKVNSLAVQLPVSTYLKDGKLMVPLSFVAKSLGYEYDLTYRPVATVSTKPTKPEPNPNTITGKVTYSGKGIVGINVRIVNRDYDPIKGATTKTAADGSFGIGGLVDGQYMAYVYVGDNPAYFNCASDLVTLKSGTTAEVKIMAIGRVISPVSPKPNSKVAPSDGKIKLEWAACLLAASYEVSIQRQGARDRLPDITTKTPSAKLSTIGLKSGAVYEIEVRALDASKRYIGWTVGAGGKPWSFTYAGSAASTGRTR